jgi:hypothetical protein
MAAGPDAEFRLWVVKHLDEQPVLSASREFADYLENARRVLRDPASLSWLSRPDAERAVCNVANGLGYVLGEENVPPATRLN